MSRLMLSPVSIEDLAEAMEREGTTVLDVRPLAAWNGWELRGESRGGHMAGALPFPLRWLDDLPGEAATAELTARGVTPDSDVVVYGYGADDAVAAAERLAELGFGNVRVFEEGLPAWADDPDRKMSRLTRFRRLVYPDWVATLLEGGEPLHHDGGRFVVAHTAFENRHDYDVGHIPGAVYLDVLSLEERTVWNRLPPDELTQVLEQLGITHDTTVVLYGRAGEPGVEPERAGLHLGQLGAMRAAWILLYAGVEDVRVLDGGLASWVSSGRPLSKEETPPASAVDFGTAVPARPELFIGTPEARKLLADPFSDLVSIRTWEEFIGEFGSGTIEGPKGRIPGAVFGNCGDGLRLMRTYRNHDHTMRSYHEIAEFWREVGITYNVRVAFCCGSGRRSCEAAFYAHLMGWGRVAVYDDSWLGWSSEKGNPIAAGVPDGYEGTGRPPGLLRTDFGSEEQRSRLVETSRPNRPPEECGG